MIFAIPVESESNHSPLAMQFARAKYYAIVDRTAATMEILPNPCLGMVSQAGKCSILYLTSRKHVNTIIAYELGHNVQQIALKENIQLILVHEKRKNLNQLLEIMNINLNNKTTKEPD